MARRSPGWSRRRWLLTLLLAAPLLGLVGVSAAELVPDGRIAANLVNAIDRDELRADDRTISMLGTTADHYAECVAVTVGLGDHDGHLVRRALFSPASYGCVPAVGMLAEFAATGVLEPRPDYMRYWHGSAVLTRPALAIVGLSGARWIAIGVLVLAVGGFCRSIARRFGAGAAALTVVPALMTTDMITGGWSIAQALGMATAWAGGWLVFAQTTRRPDWQIAGLAAAIGGAVNAYVDLMVAIPASLVLCTIAAGLAVIGPGRGVVLRPVATVMGAAVAGWGAGLGGMWASKWVLAWLFVDRDRIIDSVRNQVEFRTGGSYEGVTGTRLTGLTKNVSYWIDQPLAPAVALAVIGALGFAGWRWFSVRSDAAWIGIRDVVACGAVAAVPVAAWYVILNNHNQIHVWQTYRSVAVAIGALAAFVFAAFAAAEPAGPAGELAKEQAGEDLTERTGIPPPVGVAVSLASSGNGFDGAITPEPSEERDRSSSEGPH